MRLFRRDEWGNGWWDWENLESLAIPVMMFVGFAVGALGGVWVVIGVHEFCR